jgi:pimeloyl-ACP methyl ester carboxylesterase
MPYANNQGIRIHYRVEGEGRPLVLQHGYTQSLEHWYQCGYVDALKAHYRLVLLDARGHGGSDKPHERAAYAWPVGVMDVFAVLDALGIRRALYWGYSMGGSIGFGALTVAPERIIALVAGGAAADAFTIGDRLQHVDGSDPEAFVTAFESVMNAPIPPAIRATLLASDTRALAAAAQNRPSLIDRLSRIATPCFLYAGDRDFVFSRAKATAAQIASAKFQTLPGLTHPEGFMRSDLALPHVLAFLNGVPERRQPNNGMEPTG